MRYTVSLLLLGLWGITAGSLRDNSTLYVVVLLIVAGLPMLLRIVVNNSGTLKHNNYPIICGSAQAYSVEGSSQSSTTVYCISSLSAPSGAPLSVSVTPLPPTTLLVSWQPPDCLTWNSPSLTYTIAYHSLTDEGGRGEEEMVVSVAGGSLQLNLTDLDSLTLYNVSVRAGNGQGSGPARQGVTAIIITGRDIYCMS